MYTFGKMKLFVIILLGLLLPALISGQINCHRCFGNSYCNDANHVDFSGHVQNATCPTPSTRNSLDKEDDDSFMTEVENIINRNIRKQFDDQAVLYNTTVQHLCVTATVEEAHDTHTLRTCITRNINSSPNQPSQSLCTLIAEAIAPANSSNSTFLCNTCTGNFCNTHTLRTNHGLNLRTVSLFLIMIATLLHSLN